MKTTLLIYFALLVACQREDNEIDALDSADAAALAGMQQQTTALRQTITQLVSATTPSQRHHWDSVYHHQDSVYWHHHHQ